MIYTYHMAKNESGTDCMVVVLQDGRSGSICPVPQPDRQMEWARTIAQELSRAECSEKMERALQKISMLSHSPGNCEAEFLQAINRIAEEALSQQPNACHKGR